MRRSFQDFLINPTYAMEDQPLSMMPLDDKITIMPPHEMYSFKPYPKTPEPVTTLQDLRDERLFWRGYTSEEEAASPLDTDDMSFHSVSTDTQLATRSSKGSLTHELARICSRVEQQCARAQAITLVPAGKAKVISVPRLIEVSAAPRPKEPATATLIRPPVSRLNHVEVDSRTSSQHSRTNSPSTSGEQSPISTAPSSVADVSRRMKSVRRRPNFAAVSVVSPEIGTSDSSSGPVRYMRAVSFLSHDPYPSAPSERPTTPMSPSKRRLRKLSSSLSLNIFAKGLRRNESSDDDLGEVLENVKEPEHVIPTPVVSRLPVPVRKSSIKARMVPRGASEREPPLVLPPCPAGYHDEDDISGATWTRWQSTKDSSELEATTDSSTRLTKLHKRQRSYSPTTATTQA